MVATAPEIRLAHCEDTLSYQTYFAAGPGTVFLNTLTWSVKGSYKKGLCRLSFLMSLSVFSFWVQVELGCSEDALSCHTHRQGLQRGLVVLLRATACYGTRVCYGFFSEATVSLSRHHC